MKQLLEVLFKNSRAIQLACDIGAKIVFIAVGSLIIGRHIMEKVAEVRPVDVASDKPIGFKVRN